MTLFFQAKFFHLLRYVRNVKANLLFTLIDCRKGKNGEIMTMFEGLYVRPVHTIPKIQIPFKKKLLVDFLVNVFKHIVNTKIVILGLLQLILEICNKKKSSVPNLPDFYIVSTLISLGLTGCFSF